MNVHELQHSMYELPGPSVAQRITLAWFAAVWGASVWWLLFGGGLKTTSGWFGRPRKSHALCRDVEPGRACSEQMFQGELLAVRAAFTNVFSSRLMVPGESRTIRKLFTGRRGREKPTRKCALADMG